MTTKPNAGPPIICGRLYVPLDPEQTAEIKRVERKNDAIQRVVDGLNAALAAVDDFAKEYGPEDALLETVGEAVRKMQFVAGAAYYPDLDMYCPTEDLRRVEWRGEVETI
ncbi:hypothetical protein [Brevibacillus sp. NL20B1]|uniref:hypothetical protein n=1 Tax=Brevibacillus sp. NL20B1 TaxID=2829799 RepID=UPI001B9D08D4|nr:hypothetical protein [Brevibacillus sp. NL20B1]MBR8661187.1 hypothetical protein [Brevibacillus sp. NL20B1]